MRGGNRKRRRKKKRKNYFCPTPNKIAALVPGITRAFRNHIQSVIGVFLSNEYRLNDVPMRGGQRDDDPSLSDLDLLPNEGTSHVHCDSLCADVSESVSWRLRFLERSGAAPDLLLLLFFFFNSNEEDEDDDDDSSLSDMI